MSEASVGASGVTGTNGAMVSSAASSAPGANEVADLAAALGGAVAAGNGGSVADPAGQPAGYGLQIIFGPDDGRFTSGVTPLLEYGLLKVHGADAAAFLQAQLTNDVAGLKDAEVRLAGYCSVKGRLMASFWVWRDEAQQTFWLACSRDLAAAVARRLSMYVLRAKAKVENLSEALALVGVVGVGNNPLPDFNADSRSLDGGSPAAAAGTPGPVRLPLLTISAPLAAALDPSRSAQARELQIARAILPLPATALQHTLELWRAGGARLLSTQVWRRLEVLSGVARINAANQELFVPQMVNFELVGGVSFSKGCYPGQEIVARSQYLGKLKRRMFLALGRGPVPLSGVDVSAGTQATEPVGQVVLAASLGDDDRFVALFESRTAAVSEEGTGQGAGQAAGLRTGSSALSRLPLPYPLPPPAVQ